jgi:hypothetical protein
MESLMADNDQQSNDQTAQQAPSDTTAQNAATQQQAPQQAPQEQPAPAAPAAPTPTPTAPAPVVKQPAASPVSATLPKPQPVTKPVTAPVPVKTAPAAPVEKVDFRTLIARAQAEATNTGRILLQQLSDYMEAMAPRAPITVSAGSRQQVVLYRMITRMINTLDEDFNLVFTTFLRLFSEHADGVFSETHVFRFMEHIALGSDEIKTFQRLLNLFKNVADPKGRAAGLKMTDFSKTLEFGITDEGRSRILGYFNK